MDYLPIFVSTKAQRIVVAGEGQLAEAKCRAALKTTAAVTLFSEAPTEAMREWANQRRLTLQTRPWGAADLEGVRLVYAASDNEAANQRLAGWARQAGAWVNVLDEPEACDFITPAVVDRDPVVVAIGTEGTAPVLARQIKADVEAMLPQHVGRLARAAESFRQRVSETLSPGRPRRQFWKAFFKLELPHAETSVRELAQSLRSLLSQHEQLTPPEGRVAFVGAGPGDPELLTMKARRLIHEADVVVYDRLVGKEVLELARREAKFISAGKKGFGPAVSQQKINAHLIREATGGAFVVRLKGGDPGLFGRLDEELDAVTGAGIVTEVVPGITAASAAAAALQVSLTRRHRNSSTTFLTAHDAEGFAEHEWRQLVRSGQSLAVYMGRTTATFLQGRLLMHGADRHLPVTCIENVSLPTQRAFVSDLGHFSEQLDAQGFDGPLIILVGIADTLAKQNLDVATAALQSGGVAVGSA
jgi:uroporphyrin-III C-methyltransferase/precorrin-2 dehydrogenase/sirohydrochlorin ferrochelatase